MTASSAQPLAWMPDFLAALAETGVVRQSVKRAGITLPTAYDARTRHPGFAAAWTEALASKDHRAEKIAQLCAAPKPDPAAPDQAVPAKSRYWQTPFFDALAQTSNVSASAAYAEVELRVVYKKRREDREFAGRWLAALHEGYDNLEMELLGYLREPHGKPKMDVTAAMRLLAAHRQTVERHRALNDEEDERATLESIDAFIEGIRQRRLTNAAILIEPEPADGTD